MPTKKMNPLSFDLGNVLLKRHREICGSFSGTPETVKDELIQKATISYKELLMKVGAPPTLAKSVGTYLGEVADWCDARCFPPVNALAINATLGMPGTGYFTAAGASGKWGNDVRKCIVFRGYPPRISD
jgi:hypothetical protein